MPLKRFAATFGSMVSRDRTVLRPEGCLNIDQLIGVWSFKMTRKADTSALISKVVQELVGLMGHGYHEQAFIPKQ